MSSEAGRFVTITILASFIGSRSIIIVAYQHAPIAQLRSCTRVYRFCYAQASSFPNPSTISGRPSRLPALVPPVSGFRVLQTRPPAAYRVAAKRCDLIIRPCQLRFFNMPCPRASGFASRCVSRDLTLIPLSTELVLGARQK